MSADETGRATLSPYDLRCAKDAIEVADRILPLLALAQSNWPASSDTEVTLQTTGCNPSAKMTVSSYDLKRLVEAGRVALADSATDRRG